MSANPLFRSTLLALDAIFPMADHEPAIKDAELADQERTTLTLSNGDLIDVDVFQISHDCWTAKDANHDDRCGVDDTREAALEDLLQICEDDLEDTDIDDPQWRPEVFP